MRLAWCAAIGVVGLAACDASVSGGTPRRDGGAAGADAGGRDGAVGMDAQAPAVDSGPPLACDTHFAIAPSPGVAGRDVTVRFTDDREGYPYIGLDAAGPGAPTAMFTGVAGTRPWTWTFVVHGHAPGVLSLAFTADMGARTIARCDVRVVDGGPGADAGPVPEVDAGALTTPPANRKGIGLASPGDATDLDLTAALTGAGGHIKMIFAGVQAGTTGPDASWVEAVRGAYARNLVPVIRIGPAWGDAHVRDQSDDAAHLSYSALAAAYRRVVEGLPLRAGWPIWIEVHNEPDLCYEWACDAGSVAGGWLGYEQTAHEYAAMLRDVADALHAIGDARVKVLNAGLAPGGARRCECGSGGFEAGITSRDFLREMLVQVPDVFTRVDGFASHSYPAEGEGWGFFVPYDRAGTGLRYFESELATIGRGDLGVFMTETGWCTPGARCPMNGGTRDEIADWTEQAFRNVWLTHASIHAVMPFLLRDPAWNDFAWVAPDSTPYPVYTRIRSL